MNLVGAEQLLVDSNKNNGAVHLVVRAGVCDCQYVDSKPCKKFDVALNWFLFLCKLINDSKNPFSNT